MVIDQVLQREKWNSWNQSGGPQYPHEKVVQFVFRNFCSEVRSQTRVLDLGCGSGVHCVFLAKEGFQVTGTDLSEIGISNTQQKLEILNLKAELRIEAADELSFPPNSFDSVICMSVYDCAGPHVAQASIHKLNTLLAKGGRGLFLFASDRDFRVQDPQIGLYGYSPEEVEALFKDHFSKVWIDRYITTYKSGAIEQNDWLITVEQ